MKNIKFRIYSKLIGLEILIIILMRFLVPYLFNYPPYSEEIDFQMKIETLSHNQQYVILGILAIIVQLLFANYYFKDIFKYLRKDKKKVTKKETEHVRRECFKMPGRLFLVQTVLLVGVLLLLFSMVKISIALCLKFLLIYFSFFTASWVLSMALLQGDLNQIIESTYDINKEVTMPKKETKFYISLTKSLLPFFLFMMVIISLLGYSRVCDRLGESKYNTYKREVLDLELNGQTISGLKNELNKIILSDNSDYYFIINDSYEYFSKTNGDVTEFFLQYANDFIDRTEGRIYEYYGVEEEAYAEYITLNDGTKTLVGIKYSTVDIPTLTFYMIISVICIIVYCIILIIWTKNISKNISQVSDKLEIIAKRSNIEEDNILPVFSNDEIGKLTVSFNEIQKLTREDINQIRNSQNMLMERERLATLGQMVGGIAHNLKTPIMSIAGAMEGLQDLVNEYQKSIDDNEVTREDHHAIANDMTEWIKKVQSYDSYMSDIISTVKGQAANMTDDTSGYFTIDELIKRVNILMKHELKNALIILDVKCSIDKNTTLYGNINSLVQVVNNLISNAIQAYPQPSKRFKNRELQTNEEHIELTIFEKDNNINISVRDFGSGIPKEVQEKLFNQMITTKGHNGTGLGLFMSYSTIKGHFKGNLTFTSVENEGTTFTIVLPYKTSKN